MPTEEGDDQRRLTLISTYVVLMSWLESGPSKQMLRLVDTLSARAQQWRHGYKLMKDTGLQSGTLYPLLMRMAEQSFGRRPVVRAGAARPWTSRLSTDYDGDSGLMVPVAAAQSVTRCWASAAVSPLRNVEARPVG